MNGVGEVLRELVAGALVPLCLGVGWMWVGLAVFLLLGLGLVS